MQKQKPMPLTDLSGEELATQIKGQGNRGNKILSSGAFLLGIVLTLAGFLYIAVVVANYRDIRFISHHVLSIAILLLFGSYMIFRSVQGFVIRR